MEMVDRRGFAYRTPRRVNALRPDAPESVTAGREIEKLPVWRPDWRGVPGLPLRDREPRTFRRFPLAIVWRQHDSRMAGIESDAKRDRALVGREARLHQAESGIFENDRSAPSANLEQTDADESLWTLGINQHGGPVLVPRGYDRTAVGANDLWS